MEIKIKGKKCRVEPKEKTELPGNATFFEHKTVEQLAREQGVKPLKDVKELYGFWPADAGEDEKGAFLEAVRSARR